MSEPIRYCIDYSIKSPIKTWVCINCFFGIFLPILAIIISNFYFSPYMTFPDVTTTRYLLSALIQSEAAIIAIVISLTLISIQFTATSYSPRASSIIKGYPHNWILLSFFILSIAFNAFILKIIQDNFMPSHWFINFCLFSTIGLFIALIFNLRYTLYLLKIETILDISIIKLKGISSPYEEYNLSSIFEIIDNAIKRSDNPTAKYGLSLLRNRYFDLQKKIENKHDYEKLSHEIIEIILPKIVHTGEIARKENHSILVNISFFINDFCKISLVDAEMKYYHIPNFLQLFEFIRHLIITATSLRNAQLIYSIKEFANLLRPEMENSPFSDIQPLIDTFDLIDELNIP